MSLYNDLSARTLMIIGIIIAVLFLVVVFVIVRDLIILHKGRKQLDARIHRLLLSNMIERLGVRFDQYFGKTSDLDKERQIWRCERCPNPEQCERMFLGENVHPKTFCPNYRELEKIKDS